MICDNIIKNDGSLRFAGRDVRELADKYGTPLYLMDEDGIRKNCREYISAMSGLPTGSMPLYAGKACCFKEMYRIIGSESMGADAVSSGEIYTALSAGFPADKLYFHGNGKTDADLRYALDSGVGCIICDNADELRALSRIASESGGSQRIMLRLTPGIDPHTHEKVATGGVDSKFGSLICDGTAENNTLLAASLPGLELTGFHCHIGSQIFDAQPFVDAASIMAEFAVMMSRKHGITASVLDLGGGFGVPYVASDPTFDIAAGVRMTADALDKVFGDAGIAVPALLLEPGRSIVASAGMTLYKCTAVKRGGSVEYISVDGGMTDDPRYALYGSAYTVLNASKPDKTPGREYTVAGRCCESGDIIQRGVMLPETERGDIIAVCTTGAYNYSMASNYNRLPRPAVVMLSESGDRIAVKRESFADLIANDI